MYITSNPELSWNWLEMSVLATRTKPQAPRTLNCAILRLFGPEKFAIIGFGS
jgi:hypothetical protein